MLVRWISSFPSLSICWRLKWHHSLHNRSLILQMCRILMNMLSCFRFTLRVCPINSVGILLFFNPLCKNFLLHPLWMSTDKCRIAFPFALLLRLLCIDAIHYYCFPCTSLSFCQGLGLFRLQHQNRSMHHSCRVCLSNKNSQSYFFQSNFSNCRIKCYFQLSYVRKNFILLVYNFWKKSDHVSVEIVGISGRLGLRFCNGKIFLYTYQFYCDFVHHLKVIYHLSWWESDWEKDFFSSNEEAAPTVMWSSHLLNSYPLGNYQI